MVSGIVTCVKPERRANAYHPIVVTLPSEGITLSMPPRTNVLVSVLIRQLFLLYNSRHTKNYDEHIKHDH